MSPETFGQWIIPSDRRGTWEQAGYSAAQRAIPRAFEVVINIKDQFGAHGNGVSDDTPALTAFFQYYDGLNPKPISLVLFFPTGTYKIATQIGIKVDPSINLDRKGIVVRGDGSSLTLLKFDATVISGPLIRVDNTERIGIENLRIIRDPYVGNGTNNIEFVNSKNCWVYGVESEKTGRFHVNISGGNNIVVKGSYFYDADYLGPGGFGYGVNIGNYAYNCLVEDNIFRRLRHAVAFQSSAHDNVAGYNFVREGRALGFNYGIGFYYRETDIVCHGSGNYNNLIEGNVVDIMGVDSVNGDPGANNTFFRNRVLLDYYVAWPFEKMNKFIRAPNLNLVGNDYREADFDLFSPAFEQCSSVLDVYAVYAGNNDERATHDSRAISPGLNPWLWVLRDHSFYYIANLTSASRPDFLNVPNVSWPAIGPKRFSSSSDPFPDGTNAAEQRWHNAPKKTVDAPQVQLITKIAGNTTVPQGEVLRIVSQEQIMIEPGAKLTVYGKLEVLGTSNQRISLTPVSGTWEGIEFSGSSNSSLQYCDITYALSPVVIKNGASNITIDNVTIGNSRFHGVSPDWAAAAIAVYGSSASISNSTITGNGVWGWGGSQNGIRFAQGSTGGVSGCTIQNLGCGNGIVVQGGSTPTISGNVIRNNYFHGITINDQGSNPLVSGNTIYGNRYNGIRSFSHAAGKLRENIVYGNDIGIHVEWYSSAQSGWWGDPWWEPGRNRITGNRLGILAYYDSHPVFGIYDAVEDKYYGACNHIYGNEQWNAYAYERSSLHVQGNWWGTVPPDESRIGSTADSWVSYLYWRPYDDPDCLPGSGGGGPLAAELSLTPTASLDNQALLQQALLARLKRRSADAQALYKSVLLRSRKEQEQGRALVGLMEVWKESRDPSIVADINQYGSAPGILGIIANELLMGIYAASGRFEQMKATATLHKMRYAGTEHEKFALLQLASLAGYSESQRATAQAAYRELLQKYPDTDKGLLVAINPGVPQEKSGTHTSQALADAPLLSNFPNPFNPTTTIQFSVTHPGRVSLRIYDLLGRELATLVDERKEPGVYSVRWDAGSLPSGMYFYRLEANGRSYVQKMLLVR